MNNKFYKHFDKQLLPKVFYKKSLICPDGHSDLKKLKFLDIELGGIVGKIPELIPILQVNSSIAIYSSFMLIVFQ